METTEANTLAIQQQKHLFLHQKIKEIHTVKTHLETLLRKITNKDEREPESENSQVECEPSLEQVLNDGANRIDITCNGIHDLIDKIESTLF